MRQHRDEWERLPRVAEAVASLQATVKAEDRQDRDVPGNVLRMDSTGRLVLNGNGTRYGVTEESVPPLALRLGMTSAGAFLKSIPAEERAYNINHAAARAKADKIKCRTRLDKSGDRYVWAVTGPDYAAVDADRIAGAVGRAIREPDARANVTYDGVRTSIDALYFSDVKPENAVAGEVFRVGVRVRSHDGGGGSVRIASVVWANLCLNFIIIGADEVSEGRYVHRGSKARLEDKIAHSLYAARERVGVFVERWGLACAEDFSDRIAKLDPDPLAIEAATLLGDIQHARGKRLLAELGRSRVLAPRAFAEVLNRKVLPIHATPENVAGLVKAWSADTSSARRNPEAFTRASLVNAATRFAHEGQPSPWLADEIERAAGKLLTSKAAIF